MNLKERNNLYIEQKREIERLKDIIKFYEKNQISNMNIRDFLKEKCINGFNLKVKALELYQLYKQWCEKYNLIDLDKNDFYNFVIQSGFNKKRGIHNIIYFYGIGLKDGVNAPKTNL